MTTGIVYSGSTNIRQQIAIDTPATYVTNLFAALQTAGWTPMSAINGYSVVTFSSNPGSGAIWIINGISYTWVTTLNNAVPYQVLIGASVGASAANMAAAFNCGTGAGTVYSSATVTPVANTISTVSSGGVLTITETGPGLLPAFTRSDYATVATTTPAYRILCKDGQQYGSQFILSVWAAGSAVRHLIQSVRGKDSGGVPTTLFPASAPSNTTLAYIQTGAGATMWVLAGPWHLYAVRQNDDLPAHSIFIGIQHPTDEVAPLAVASIGASPDGLIRVVTTDTHGYGNGDIVALLGYGIPTVDGGYQISYVDAFTFDLVGSDATQLLLGTPGSKLRVASSTQTAELMYVMSTDEAGPFGYTVRNRYSHPWFNCKPAHFQVIYNEQSWAMGPGVGPAGTNPQWMRQQGNATWMGSRSLISRALFAWPHLVTDPVIEWRGAMYDTVCVNRNYPLDLLSTQQTGGGWDSHSWQCIVNDPDNAFSIWTVIP